MVDFSQLFAKVTSGAGASTVAQALNPVAQTPVVQVNRDRAGVVAHDTYLVSDAFNRSRMFLFLLGLAGMAGSGYGLYKRRKLSTETFALYTITGIASAILTYLARPGAAPDGAPVRAPDGTTTTSYSPQKVLDWLDRRAATIKSSDPNALKDSLDRLIRDANGGQPASALVESIVRS